MRLAGQAKKGFYPLPDVACEMIADRIVADESTIIFDPCAGEGAAVKAIASRAGIPESNIYVSELDIGRTDVLRESMPEAKVFGPLDFLAAFHYGAASIAYVNPPFDDELGGGGRIEWKFIDRALDCVAPGGLAVIVLPESVAKSLRTGEVLRSRLESIQIFDLPEDVRKFGEVVIFGIVRKEKVRPGWYSYKDYVVEYEAIDRVVTVPGKPVVVRKVSYTDEELADELTRSEAQKLFCSTAKPRARLVRPPMEMRKGHRAMLLASGFLDGVVDSGDGDPHVVRGSAVKRTEKKEEASEGVIKVTETERIYLVVKVATSDGRVVTLTDQIKDDEPVESEEEVEC